MKLLDIPFSQAWHFCWQQPSYVISVIILIVVAVAVAIKGYLMYRKTQEAVWALVATILAVVIITAALLARPCSVEANTNPDQAARGVFIG